MKCNFTVIREQSRREVTDSCEHIPSSQGGSLEEEERCMGGSVGRAQRVEICAITIRHVCL